MHLRPESLKMQGSRAYAFFCSCLQQSHSERSKQSSSNSFFRNKKFVQVRIILMMVIFSVGIVISGYSQRVTISKSNAPIQSIFTEIEKQTQYSFFYNEAVLQKAVNVTIDVKDVPLQEALNTCFKNQELTYALVDKTIIVKKKDENKVSDVVENVKDKIGVAGKVTTRDGKPIAGATVTVRGTNIAVATDADGVFRLSEVEDDATLVITNVAYLQKEVKINKQGYVTISLEENISDLDEAIVVGYSNSTERIYTGAVTVIKGSQIQSLPNRSIDKSLQGLVPGLLVTSGSGQPGSAPANFVLRGIATGGQPLAGETYRYPLVVIDGVPVIQDPGSFAAVIGSAISNPMAQLNPSDVESISVLKDAAAIALYGSKASNGVIVITTKKGKEGKTIFNFRHQTDISSRVKENLEVLNQEEYLELLFETYRNSNPTMSDAAILANLRKTPSPTQPKFPVIISASGDSSFYPSANWIDALYNKSATTFINEISISGGSKQSNFYLNFEYVKQKGVVKHTGYDRKSLKFNYENRPASWVRLGVNTTLSYNLQDYSNTSESSKIFSISPLNPIYDINGNYIYNYRWGLSASTSPFGSLTSNPIAETELNIKRNIAYRGLGRLYGSIKFLKHFNFSSSFGFDFMLNEATEKIRPEFVLLGEPTPGNGSINKSDKRVFSIVTTNTLSYDKMFGKDHSINLLAGQEAQVRKDQYITVEKRGIADNPLQDQIVGSLIYIADGDSYKQGLLSYFGQINYGFRNKYLLSGSIRTDGSSSFGKNERFGTYWSVGGAWILTEESFMRSFKNSVNYLKLRGSFGASGNSAAIAASYRLDPLQLVTYLNNPAVLPLRPASPGNPEIQWEQTFSWDVGLESRFINGRIILKADLYTRKTAKLIALVDIPFATGSTSMPTNIGDLKNQGLEISISTDIIHSKTIRWNLSANWSKNQNKLTKSFYPQLAVSGSNLINMVGEAYNSFYLKRWAGVNPDNGRPMWMDSTGKPSENYNAAKREIVGKTQPDGFGSVTNTFVWKNLEFSTSIYYQYGFQIYYPSPLTNDGLYPYINQGKNALNRWQKPGDIAANPRRLLNGRITTSTGTVVDQGTSSSTRYLFDGDFIRLANIQLAYTIPSRLLERSHLSSVRFFIQAHNLATWTKYSGQDPENVGVSGNGGFFYPQQRSYTIGLNVSF